MSLGADPFLIGPIVRDEDKQVIYSRRQSRVDELSPPRSPRLTLHLHGML